MWHQGSCHCQAVKFEVNAPAIPDVTACNCSMCKIYNYHHLIVSAKDFKLLQGAEDLSTYTFNTEVAKHTFCTHCGVKSFYTPRSHPDGISVNLFCLEPVPKANISQFDGQHWEENIDQL